MSLLLSLLLCLLYSVVPLYFSHFSEVNAQTVSTDVQITLLRLENHYGNDNENNYGSQYQHQDENQHKNHKKSTKFTDLNIDVLLLIVEFLSLPELLHLAEINDGLNSIASDVFRRKYRNYEIEVLRLANGDDVEERFHLYAINHKQIEITDYHMALKVFEHFGRAIRKLSISANMCKHHSIVIDQMINRYCSESITHLDLGFIEENTLQQFTAPFKAVESFTCYIYKEIQPAKILPFDKLFPKISHLKLTLSADIEYTFIDCELPHLQHLDVNLDYDRANKRGKQIEGLLRKNKQIKSIEIRDFPTDYIKEIKYYLPNLENLTLNEFDIRNETIQLENVKHLKLRTSHPKSIDKLSISSLESLDFMYKEELFGEWVSFFRNHSFLGILHITTCNYLNVEHFMELMAEVSHLVEMKLKTIGYFSAETIVKIIRNFKQLMTFELSLLIYGQCDFNILQKQFENEWIIEVHSGKVFRMKRI